MSSHSQRLQIFLTMCDTNESGRKESMHINIYKNAQISDLIGLICCKYINEKRSPHLK